MDKQFWQGKKVFITGHTGFKGGWLSLWLQDAGAQVTGVALPPQGSPNLYDVLNIAHGMRSNFVDIRNYSELLAAYQQAEPDIVFHLAAQPLVRYSYENPIETYEVNVLGTVHLLEAVRQFPCARAVVVVTSDKCYENREWQWGYRESDAIGGYDPYSNSKGCAELVTAAYRSSYFGHSHVNPSHVNPSQYGHNDGHNNGHDGRQHGVAIGSARAGNVIGGGDWAQDRLIPDIIRAMQAGSNLVIRNPKAIRPWQHVLEPLSGYVRLAEKLFDGGIEAGDSYGEAWNFGPVDADVQTVEWIVNRLSAMIGVEHNWDLSTEQQPHEAHYLKLDSSKARARLNWRPSWGLEVGLQKAAEWYLAFKQGADMRELSLRQVSEFERAL